MRNKAESTIKGNRYITEEQTQAADERLYEAELKRQQIPSEMGLVSLSLVF